MTAQGGADDVLVPPGVEPWCSTLRGEQAWRLEVAGGPTALDTWSTLRDRHAESGLWPIVLGGDLQAIDQLTWRLESMARAAPGIVEGEAVPDAPELFIEWLGNVADDDYLNDVPRHLAKLEADQEQIRARLTARPDSAAVRAISGERVHVGLIPAKAGWEVPALLAWSGAERLDVGGPEHLAVLRFWNETYGAELVSLGLETLELLVADPPAEARAAFELAVQQYAYCPALMDNLVPAMGALAATLLGRNWYFDWS